MAISKVKKKGILENLNKIFKDSMSVVFINFHGLSVNNTTEMRKALMGEKVSYVVAKKSLTQKALSESGVSGQEPELDGELGLAYGDDLVGPARGVFNFQKKFENKLTILGGIFESRFLSKEEMTNIAQIPSTKTLHAQFVNLINSPIQGFVMALSEIAKTKSS